MWNVSCAALGWRTVGPVCVGAGVGGAGSRPGRWCFAWVGVPCSLFTTLRTRHALRSYYANETLQAAHGCLCSMARRTHRRHLPGPPPAPAPPYRLLPKRAPHWLRRGVCYGLDVLLPTGFFGPLLGVTGATLQLVHGEPGGRPRGPAGALLSVLMPMPMALLGGGGGGEGAEDAAGGGAGRCGMDQARVRGAWSWVKEDGVVAWQ